jgi:hypothetical protein
MRENAVPLLLFADRYILTAVVSLFVSRSLPSNESTCHSNLEHDNLYTLSYILMAYKPVAKRRPRGKQIYNSRC